MSAIFGIFGPHDVAAVRRMGEALKYRGAEISIRTLGGDISVGAIGRDPEHMIVAVPGGVVVADGTLYNQRDLDRSFATGTSTTTADALSRLELAGNPARLDAINGDFAFAAYQRERDGAHFARDFFGSHPLYVCRLQTGAVAFASEYKALVAARDAAVTVDREMLQYLQCAKRLPVGRTLVKDILEVAPGAVSAFDGTDGLRVLHAYPPLAVNVAIRDEATAIDLILQQLRAALELRIADLQTVGLALSGGIDSIALAFLLREMRPDAEIYTFSAGTDDDDQELKTAATVAKAIGSHHQEIVTPPEIIRDHLPELVWHLEDPFSRSEALQLYEVGRAAGAKVDVLFSAQGADGLFAGMPKYRLLWLADKLPMFRAGFEEFFFLTQLGRKPRTAFGKLFDYLKYRGQVPLVPVVQGAALATPTPFPEAGPELVNRAASRGFQYGVCQDVHKFERSFAAFGLEHRSPFYDLNLVRAAYTITDKLKITRKSQKYIFRKAMENIVPDEFRQIPKFPQRMRYDRTFADILDEVGKPLVLGKGGLRDRGLFDAASLERLFRPPAQQVYRDEAAMRIWTAANTELWMRAFVDPHAD